MKDEFTKVDSLYGYDGPLGAEYTGEKTTFRLWAPKAAKAQLNLYRNGSGGEPYYTAKMSKSGGVWSAEVSGDLHGVYYTYSVTTRGVTNESIDPYAVSAGLNGRRGMVLDLTRTNPAGWEREKPVSLASPADAVIYELHVRDFSMDASAGFKSRGKFAAFCEKGVTNRFGDTVGLDYIAALGVTHIHLLPVFDFATVDESGRGAQFNWGYDPLNYNAPEGSYSIAPHNGFARVKELKCLVFAAHKRGLGVVMDVVYNHTYSADKSPFGLLYPGYYYRRGADGKPANGSGCGNEFASERKMAGRFICDSLCFWAREYKLDGFRFDLMGLIDTDTMNRCAAALRKINPDILLYGEGWTGGVSPLAEEKKSLKTNVRRLDGIAVFSDDFRDGVKGSVFVDEDCGYVNGDPNRAELIKSVLVGGVAHPEITRPKEQLWTDEPLCCVNYVEAHDNLTLYDKLRLSMPQSSVDEIKAVDKLAAALVFTAQGIPFIQAGQELLRSKPIDGGFDHNSYRSPDSVNCIKWDDVHYNEDILSYYRGLIAIRRAYPELRLRTADQIRAGVRFEDLAGGAFVMKTGRLAVVYNPTDKPIKYRSKGNCTVLADWQYASAEGIRAAARAETVYPRSVIILKETEN